MAGKTKFLLHVCCAPCSTHVIESLKEKLDITCYFYNPNIWPISEYRTRLKDARGFCRRIGMPIMLGSYDSELWILATRGFEDEPEGGKRCEICFYFRLLDTARTASRLGFDLFGTTLTISPHKNPEAVNEAGRRAGRVTGMAFCEGDYKKKDGFLRSIELSKKYHLYRQSYCGCRYSIRTP
ncbi:MAG: epoxyqueuosine reductase QueH [Candidatus Tritonobacter lacicola]|nr:epoxyqueuosine reductase QueH [Candidatus Tritonobacter lacicola]